jgi:CHAT domain-containing protein
MRGESDLASAYQGFAWEIARQKGQWQHQALAHWCSGIAQFHHDPRKASKELACALNLYQEHNDVKHEARILVGLGALRGQLGEDQQAEADLQRAKELLPADYHDWAALYLNISDLLRRQGRYSESLEHAQRAEHCAKVKTQPDCRIQALINQALASIYIGRTVEAEQMLREAQEIGETSPFADLSGRIMLTLAHLDLAKGQSFDALQLLRQAEEYFKIAGLDFEQATVRLEEAALYERLNLISEAQHSARLAAEAFTEAEVLDESVEARHLAARYALDLQQLQRANKELQEAFALLEGQDSFWHVRLNGYSAHPGLQRTTQQRKQALKKADQARALLRERNDIEACLEIDLIAAQLASQLKLPDSLERYQQIIAAARTLQRPHLEQRACIELAAHLAPDTAYPLLRRAADIAAHERRLMHSEELKAHMLSRSLPLYAQLIEVQLQIGNQRQAAETLLEAKGNLWAELALPPIDNKLDAAVMQAHTTLNMLYVERRLALDEQKAAYHKKIEQALQNSIMINRRYAREHQPLQLPSAIEIQSALASNSIIIDYLVSGQELIACVFRSEYSPHWIRLGSITDILDQINRFHDITTDLHHSESTGYRQESALALQSATELILRSLYDKLISPITHLVPKHSLLGIAPDGPLFAIPWGSLLGPNGYLGECHQIILLPSAANYALSIASEVQIQGHPIALGYSGEPGLLELPAVEEELKAIHGELPMFQIHHPAKQQDVQWEQAPEILHIATHGSLNERVPLLSHLELADGPLLLVDALNLNLHGTSLVTLSACVSASLPTQGGLMLTLAGAFLSAGAQTVIASLWPVDDRATRVFMGQFYRSVGQGNTFATAIQQAQSRLRDTGFSHPYYWGAFQLFCRTCPTR